MNKTIIASVVTITLGMVIIFCVYIFAYASKTQIQVQTETKDRLTICLQVVMFESRESGKPIGAKEAREICS